MMQNLKRCNILITGATGNTGSEVIRFLAESDSQNRIFAGVRDIEKAKPFFSKYPNVNFIHFDFEDPSSFHNSLKEIDRVFLLRPPHISDTDKYFKPLISSFVKNNVKEILFLSVQGAERSSVIPHNKIENLIRNSGMDYIFLRPSYFMQNLTTTLINDIRNKREIVLPAGKAKFNWIDVLNIGEAAAILLDRFEEFKNQAFEITGYENKSFEEVVGIINESIKSPVRYRNVNPLKFYRIKKKDGMIKGMIIVMILLHFLPRFQKPPRISGFYEHLTGRKPGDLRTFILREKRKFEL